MGRRNRNSEIKSKEFIYTCTKTVLFTRESTCLCYILRDLWAMSEVPLAEVLSGADD